MEKTIDLVTMVVGALIFAFILSGASERVTEAIKMLLRKATKGKFPQGDWSQLLALIPAIGMVYGLDVEFFKQFKIFETLDAEMLQALNALFLWMASNWNHQNMKRFTAVRTAK